MRENTELFNSTDIASTSTEHRSSWGQQGRAVMTDHPTNPVSTKGTRWPMRLGAVGAMTGRAVSEDVAGRYQPVTVYQRKSSKLRQLLGIGGWFAGVSYVVAFLTQTPILVDAVEWVREAPAEQVAGGTVTLVIFWGTCKIIGRAIRIGQNRTRLVYVTSGDDEQVRSPKPLLPTGPGTGKTHAEVDPANGDRDEWEQA